MNPTLDELSKLAQKFGADKWSRKHNYTPVYFKLFKNRRKSVKKVLEIGIGEHAASLKMWRDFFPNAKIYGVDYMSSRLVKDNRIESFLCDQRRREHLLALIEKTGSDIDLVVDDGSHRPRDQVFTCLNLMPQLKKGVTYIIEDVADPAITERLSQYDVQMPKLEYIRRYDNRLVVVRHKSTPMKNLLVYIHPEKIFVYGTDALIRVQIDNSLELGWKREDILLVTNFDYQYNGVKAMVIGDENYCVHSPTSSTMNAIITLFVLEVIGDDLYWFHNIDAFQLEENIEPYLGVADMATTDSIDVFAEDDKYFGAHRWDNAVIYFKKSSRDIFEQIKKNMNRYRVNEEIALMKVELCEKENPTFSDRIKILNTTYNFCAKTIDENFEKRYEIAEKPIKIIHFNPFDKRNLRTSKFLFNVCVRGQNAIGKALVTEKLRELLSQYEI